MTKQPQPTWEGPDLASVPLFTAFGDSIDAARPGRVRSGFTLTDGSRPDAHAVLPPCGRPRGEGGTDGTAHGTLARGGLGRGVGTARAGVQALLRACGAVAVRGRGFPPRAGAGRDHGGRPRGDGGALRRPRLRQFRQRAGRLGAGRLRPDVRARPVAALGGSGGRREHHRRRTRPGVPGPGGRREGAGAAGGGVRRGTDPAPAGPGLPGRSAARVLGRQPGPPPEPRRRSPGGVRVRHPSAERGDPKAPPGAHHPRRPRGPGHGEPLAGVVPRGRGEGTVVDRGLRANKATGRRPCCGPCVPRSVRRRCWGRSRPSGSWVWSSWSTSTPSCSRGKRVPVRASEVPMGVR